MVDRLAARKTIYDTFGDAASIPGTVFFDNDDAKPPTDSTAWAICNVIFLDNEGPLSGQVSVGTAVNNRLFRRWGRLVIQVFVARNTGTKASDDFCDVIKDLFEGKTIDNVTFWDTEQQSIGLYENIWYQQNVTARFWFDEIK